jgi:hypothetical protein
MTPRGAGAPASAAPPEPIRSGRAGAGLEWGGARTRPRVGEGEAREELPDDRGIVERGDQAQAAPAMGTRQHADAERPVHEGRPTPGARGGLHSGLVQTRGPRRRRSRRLGPHASVRDPALAPPRARGQHALANEQVGFGPRRHRGQPFQELQRLEDQFSRPIVPRALELQRDAAAAPQPQALRRADARRIDTDARPPPDRATPTRWRANRSPRRAPAAAHATSPLPWRARRRAARPALPRGGPAPPAPGRTSRHGLGDRVPECHVGSVTRQVGNSRLQDVRVPALRRKAIGSPLHVGKEPPGALDVEWSLAARITEPASDALSLCAPVAAVGKRKATNHRPPKIAKCDRTCTNWPRNSSRSAQCAAIR